MKKSWFRSEQEKNAPVALGKTAHNRTQFHAMIIASRRGPLRAASFFFGGDCVAILKACPRCKKLIAQGRAFCDSCAPIVAAEREKAKAAQARAYNRRRDPRYLTFYRSKEWRLTSRAFLAGAGYKCQGKLDGCTGLAVEVHHIKPIQTEPGWNERLEWTNLEALCTSCHNARHERGKKKTPDGVIDMRAIQKGLF